MSATTNTTGSKVLALVLAAILALAAGIVAKWEGVRYVPYRDVVGVLTVCTGHTGSDIVEGKRYTKAECDAWLREDLAEAHSHVRRCITKRPMPGTVEAALISATYNLGPVVVCASTLQRKANAGDWRGACRELTNARVRRVVDGKVVYFEHGWTYAGGVRYRGLINRRVDERKLCESGL